MSWTTHNDLRQQTLKLWRSGAILADLVNGNTLFPKRLPIKGPSSAELLERFDEVRIWIQAIRKIPHVRLVMREIQHRQLGSNLIPAEIWLDNSESAIELIGMQKPYRAFQKLLSQTETQLPVACEWLGRRPLAALALTEVWLKLLDVVVWRQNHPNPGIYLRQIDMPGVHSKFVEAHRNVLTELLDLTLSPEQINHNATGLSQFCRRYGFLDKPTRIRFRILDNALSPFPKLKNPDFTLDTENFSKLDYQAKRVFITENEINFLAFPVLDNAMVIFGEGYGFAALGKADWLHHCDIYYWGDIDTHGFAILSELRTRFPHVKSFLMDRNTLLNFSSMWGQEDKPVLRELPNLSNAELSLYNDLRDNLIQRNLRLEQEKIGFDWVQNAINLLVLPVS